MPGADSDVEILDSPEEKKAPPATPADNEDADEALAAEAAAGEAAPGAGLSPTERAGEQETAAAGEQERVAEAAVATPACVEFPVASSCECARCLADVEGTLATVGETRRVGAF